MNAFVQAKEMDLQCWGKDGYEQFAYSRIPAGIFYVGGIQWKMVQIAGKRDHRKCFFEQILSWDSWAGDNKERGPAAGCVPLLLLLAVEVFCC